MENADELLEPDAPNDGNKDLPTEESNGRENGMQEGHTSPTVPEVDLLAQRLNDSISKALEETKQWTVVGEDTESMVVVSPSVDADARKLETTEKEVEPAWIADHTIIDEDGRARCSFHFCRKLFKDAMFLRKHLLKKHPEFLLAEIAKCHDPFMMKAWDMQEHRPVPPILVDCGHRFGFVESTVIGSTTPMAADPEPDLWRREEELQKMREDSTDERRRQRERRRRKDDYADGMDDLPPPSLDSALPSDRAEKKAAFVDVDDMQ
ncbi:MAG: hypothetical protein AAGM67_20990, partial [Bacteroidota bacterium]